MPGSRADVLGDAGQERDDIVVGDFLDLQDAFHVELRASANRREVARRYASRFAGEDFNPEPNGELVFVRPNLAHRLAAVASNHRASRLTNPAWLVNAQPNE